MLRYSQSAVCAGLIAVATVTAALAEGSPAITNATHYAIVAVQARPSGGTVWRSDLLGKATLGVGRTMPLALDPRPHCRYDLFVTFDDGHKVLRQNIDLCGRMPVQITDTP